MTFGQEPVPAEPDIESLQASQKLQPLLLPNLPANMKLKL